MSFNGLPFIGKLGDFINKVIYPTYQKVGHSRAALEVVSRGYYLLNSGTPYTVEAGSDNNIVKITTHGFKAGDLVRLSTTANAISEFEIIIDSITDANTFTLAGYLSANLTAGDLIYVSRPISEQFSSSGASLTTLTASPVQYNRKTGGVTTATNVLEDLDTPANSRSLPVVIHGLDAAVITVTGDQINVASSHVNDSVRLGDGTTLTVVTANNELKTRDADAITALGLVAQDTSIGSLTETAPATDTASSGLNGRLQRIAQRITSLIALLPASLGQKTMSASLAVTLASDQTALSVTETGNVISANNSTVALPGAGATWNGTYDELTGYATIATCTTFDQSGTLYADFSQDGITVDHTETYTLTITTPLTPQAAFFQIIKQGRYVKLRFVNGATAQTVFRIQSFLNKVSGQGTVLPFASGITSVMDALSTKSVIYGVTTAGGGAYVPVKVNPSGALTADITSAQLPAALGQGTMAQSLKVVVASDQSTIVTSSVAGTNLDTNLGAKADAVATTDTGTFSLIALAKKIAENITSMSAKLPAALGITTASASLSIAPASDAKFSIKPSTITTTYAENLALTTVTTITAPANAVSVLVMADDANANNIRIKQNATASVTSGFPIQPGRDITFDGGQDLSVISDNAGVAGASVKIYFSWKIQA